MKDDPLLNVLGKLIKEAVVACKFRDTNHLYLHVLEKIEWVWVPGTDQQMYLTDLIQELPRCFLGQEPDVKRKFIELISKRTETHLRRDLADNLRKAYRAATERNKAEYPSLYGKPNFDMPVWWVDPNGEYDIFGCARPEDAVCERTVQASAAYEQISKANNSMFRTAIVWQGLMDIYDALLALSHWDESNWQIDLSELRTTVSFLLADVDDHVKLETGEKGDLKGLERLKAFLHEKLPHRISETTRMINVVEYLHTEDVSRYSKGGYEVDVKFCTVVHGHADALKGILHEERYHGSGIAAG